MNRNLDSHPSSISVLHNNSAVFTLTARSATSKQVLPSLLKHTVTTNDRTVFHHMMICTQEDWEDLKKNLMYVSWWNKKQMSQTDYDMLLLCATYKQFVSHVLLSACCWLNHSMCSLGEELVNTPLSLFEASKGWFIQQLPQKVDLFSSWLPKKDYDQGLQCPWSALSC